MKCRREVVFKINCPKTPNPNHRSEFRSRLLQVMVELLGTYTTENASQAREEAQRCIVASLADPQTFLLDRLLQLTPVKFLQGELIHDLLKIFVAERLEVSSASLFSTIRHQFSGHKKHQIKCQI